MVKMANFKLLFLVCGVIIAGVFGAGDVHIDPQPNSNSTVPVPPQPTTSPASTTTSAPTTTTTTTLPPNVTTTTTAPPNTTTAPSTTSTTSAPTTAPTPNPPTPVDPKVANWTVNYANSNRSCIILFVAAQFEITEPSLNKTVKINVPINATASGSCEGTETQVLALSWGQNNSLEFDFYKTNASKFDLNNTVSTLNISWGTGSKTYKLIHKNPEFLTPVGNSYKCARQQTLNLTEENSNVTAYLHLSHLQYQAFSNTTEHKFNSALDCEGSVTPDVVPIVVGCVLAALVVAVLVAYLFGRRRCQARGYLSMFEETRREADYIPMKNLSCFN